MASKEIDNKIVDLFSKDLDLYIVNDKILRELRPDVKVKRIRELKNVEKLPRILCMEWLNPFLTAGHRVPEMVEIAWGKLV